MGLHLYGNGTSTSYDTLVTDINNANIGVTAAYSASVGGSGDKGIVLTGSDTSNVIAFNNNSLVDSTDASAAVATLHTIATGNNKTNVATASTAVLQLTGQNISDSGSTLNGAIQIAYHGTSQIFVMGPIRVDQRRARHERDLHGRQHGAEPGQCHQLDADGWTDQ